MSNWQAQRIFDLDLGSNWGLNLHTPLHVSLYCSFSCLRCFRNYYSLGAFRAEGEAALKLRWSRMEGGRLDNIICLSLISSDHPIYMFVTLLCVYLNSRVSPGSQPALPINANARVTLSAQSWCEDKEINWNIYWRQLFIGKLWTGYLLKGHL